MDRFKYSYMFAKFALAASCLATAASASAQTNPYDNSSISKNDWIEWGIALHGGFGTHIALGIVIGQDALQRLNVNRREVTVVVTDGALAPCACVADGIAIATSASPGQRTMVVTPQSEDRDYLVTVQVKAKRSGKTLVYRVPSSMIETFALMGPGKSPLQILDGVLAMPRAKMFEVTAL